jgi:plasmid stabilization system protein ParE
MGNTYKILWSARAHNNLEEHWTEHEIKRFARKLDRCIAIIEKDPMTFPKPFMQPNLRKAVITKENTLYYNVEGKVVRIVNIFDSRQNPNKNHLK